MSDDIQKINDALLVASAQLAIQQSQVEALRALLVEIARKMGMTFGPNGELSAQQAYQEASEAVLGSKLISLENKNPSLAAKIQELIDRNRR